MGDVGEYLSHQKTLPYPYTFQVKLSSEEKNGHQNDQNRYVKYGIKSHDG